MAIANVALTDTFDTWRVRTNQLIVLYEQSNNQITSAFANVPAAFGHANAAFDKANTGGTITGNVTFTGHTVKINANVASQTLTDGPIINWDLSGGTVATVTLGGDRLLENATNMRVGSYILHIYQDGTGNRNLNFANTYKWPAGVAPILSTANDSHDVFSFVCDGINMYGSFLPDVK